MSASQRLAALGVTLPAVSPPVGTYVPARQVGGLIYTSGQLPLVDGELLAKGVVGRRAADVSPAIAAECAQAAAINALAAAAQLVGGLDGIKGVVKVTAYLAAAEGFADHPAVLNPASAFLGEVFEDDGAHARAVVGVTSLPLGSPVEVELVLEAVDVDYAADSI